MNLYCDLMELRKLGLSDDDIEGFLVFYWTNYENNCAATPMSFPTEGFDRCCAAA